MFECLVYHFDSKLNEIFHLMLDVFMMKNLKDFDSKEKFMKIRRKIETIDEMKLTTFYSLPK